MLEEKIDKLTIEIEKLTAAITQMVAASAEPVKIVVTDVVKQEPEPIGSQTQPEAQGEAISTEAISEVGSKVTYDDLHKLCLEIVRKNPADGAKIQEVLKNNTSVKKAKVILKDIDEPVYPKLKAELEAI